MSQTINVPRELLERLAAPLPGDNGWQTWHTQEMIEASKELRAILAAPRQPEGEGLEVVAWISCDGLNDLKQGGSIARYVVPSYSGGAKIALCRLSDAQRVITELRDRLDVMTQCADNYSRMFEESAEECDTLRQQLAERDTQIASMRAEVTPFIETHWMPVARQRDKLADLLDEVKSDLSAAMNWGDLDRIAVRIDAALAEVDK